MELVRCDDQEHLLAGFEGLVVCRVGIYQQQVLAMRRDDVILVRAHENRGRYRCRDPRITGKRNRLRADDQFDGITGLQREAGLYMKTGSQG